MQVAALGHSTKKRLESGRISLSQLVEVLRGIVLPQRRALRRGPAAEGAARPACLTVTGRAATSCTRSAALDNSAATPFIDRRAAITLATDGSRRAAAVPAHNHFGTTGVAARIGLLRPPTPTAARRFPRRIVAAPPQRPNRQHRPANQRTNLAHNDSDSCRSHQEQTQPPPTIAKSSRGSRLRRDRGRGLRRGRARPPAAGAGCAGFREPPAAGDVEVGAGFAAGDVGRLRRIS